MYIICMYVLLHVMYVCVCKLYVCVHTCTSIHMKAVGNKGVLIVDKISFRASCIRSWRSIPSTRCPQSYLAPRVMRVRSRRFDVNKSTSEGSLSRSARRPCSGAEGRRAMAPRVSRQGAEPSTTRPRLEGQFLERLGRSLR